ncbi:hypothetical protein FH972_008479 [Carpinus fangiana]|uniref:Uncharacterized protein n=1 Tax=Carpinus fangiana TaxID=176857 RepID=A0A5N6QZP6_9ROSI|nr:hypothetical protein FH972_008479 [Carpinus fangiana]
MGTTSYGKRDLEGPKFNVGESDNQNTPSKEEADTAKMQLNRVVTEAVYETAITGLTPRKEADGGGSRVEDSTGNIFPSKEMTHKTAIQDLEAMESNSEALKRGKESRKSGSIYVGQWNQIKEKMEWNLMEGSKEEFCLNLETKSPSMECVNDAKLRGTHKKASLGGSHSKYRGNVIHVGSNGPRIKVGAKMREHVERPNEASPRNSNEHP